MPPQRTNITSEIEGDAAGLGLDLSIALADDVLPQKDAAGPAAASARNALGLLQRYWRVLLERCLRQSLRVTVHELSDRQLMDIGLTRGEIDYITPERAIERLRDTANLWSRGGM